MNEEIEVKLSKYNNGVKDLFLKIRKIIYETNLQIDERIWASIPSFYYGNKFIRIIPFKDYVNIEAKLISEYTKELIGYKITPKGMLRLEINQDVPGDLLGIIFKQSLTE
ncbi:DUF1801 domain-containing protein [Acholeplasma laidlawii]|uniref:DUF1801 domain-containing protein n=1 Tax=Acholeplasma laidlawii (strain PG-8A) TaxID=441768 RepID=A9NHN0_ACHLI|nr:DUF1801 domain-containing protein [Acholeplasma laidlawii]ABX81860.1 conserved hypothetical protein [Acholeplasma laidlawii PG-8A]